MGLLGTKHAGARDVTSWLEIFAKQTDGTVEGIAARILRDVWGYNNRTKGDGRFRAGDEETLANALAAYAIRRDERIATWNKIGE